MPLVRISLHKGRPADEIRGIADGVHAALVNSYGVPANDRFQIIEQLSPGDIIYSPDYLDVPRTDRLLLIHVIAGRWRDDDTKKALYAAIAAELTGRKLSEPGDIQVTITSNDKGDWSFGNGVASYLP